MSFTVQMNAYKDLTVCQVRQGVHVNEWDAFVSAFKVLYLARTAYPEAAKIQRNIQRLQARFNRKFGQRFIV